MRKSDSITSAQDFWSNDMEAGQNHLRDLASSACACWLLVELCLQYTGISVDIWGWTPPAGRDIRQMMALAGGSTYHSARQASRCL